MLLAEKSEMENLLLRKVVDNMEVDVPEVMIERDRCINQGYGYEDEVSGL